MTYDNFISDSMTFDLEECVQTVFVIDCTDPQVKTHRLNANLYDQ